MKQMIKGTDEDLKLIINIIDNCNIEESLLYILALIPHRYDEKKTMATPITRSYKFFTFLSDLDPNITWSYGRFFGIQYDLNKLIDVRKAHCIRENKNPTQGSKFLAMEYIEPPKNLNVKSITPKLNPKRKQR